ncbi:unnamed protein product [Effrenium voratum]|uniref:Uncharacterized protein n=1 Tax=Effrenium voratum TaxID=2562239 RepID=A0AA36MUM7_9DINO|nr:unnamed protein product [Effrenium voratum]
MHAEASESQELARFDAVETRSIPEFRWSFYQTDGWEGYQDEEVEEVLTRPRPPKPWHVRDEKIQAMVQEVGAQVGIPDRLLRHAKCRSPAFEDEADMDAVHEASSQAPTRTRKRSVRFADGDALDRMLQREQEAQPSGARREECDKKWKISDADFRDLVLAMAKAQEAAPPTLSCSASAPALQANPKEKILVHVHFVDSHDIMSLRVSPDLRIGPAPVPKGNRFTDIYGLGASTKGFAEFKQFDYQRRRWLGGFRKEWVPAWSVSFKGLIQDLTGMEIARQRLFSQHIPMHDDNLTLRSWNVRDGGMIQLRFQRKISASQLKAVQRACQAAIQADGDTDRCTSINPALPVQAEMASSSDFFKPMRRWNQCALRDSPSRSPCRQRSKQEFLAAKEASTRLRNSRHLRKCTSKGDVWMMPRWISQDEPGHFSPTGNPKHDVLKRDPPSFAEKGIFLQDAKDLAVSRIRQTVTGNPLYTRIDS